VGNHGRTIPVKVTLLVDGVELVEGRVDLVVTRCGDDAALLAVDAERHGGRWTGHVDTSGLPGPGCYTVEASPAGLDGPTFRLELRAAPEAGATNRAKRR
jgi:hypothetical protein